jgi:hypothetical protein
VPLACVVRVLWSWYAAVVESAAAFSLAPSYSWSLEIVPMASWMLKAPKAAWARWTMVMNWSAMMGCCLCGTFGGK